MIENSSKNTLNTLMDKDPKPSLTTCSASRTLSNSPRTLSNSPVQKSGFTVRILQEPVQARMTGFGEAVPRRMLDPPLILCVDLDDNNLSSDNSVMMENLCQRLVCSVHLYHPSKDEPLSCLWRNVPKSTSSKVSKKKHSRVVSTVLGTTVRTPVCLPTHQSNGQAIPLLLFTDLAVRVQGSFRFQCIIFDTKSGQVQTLTTSQVKIYSPQFFPGILDPTPLSIHLHENQIPIRSVCNSNKTRYKYNESAGSSRDKDNLTYTNVENSSSATTTSYPHALEVDLKSESSYIGSNNSNTDCEEEMLVNGH